MVDTATNTIVARIPVGKRPWNMAITGDGKKLYVACGRSNAVAVIDTESRTKIAEVPVGVLPWGVRSLLPSCRFRLIVVCIRRAVASRALAALGISSMAAAARADQSSSSADECGGEHPAGSLPVPTDRGWLGRLAPGDGEIVSLRAAPLAASRERGRAALTLAYFATHKGRDYRNPTLVFKTGQRVRIELVNQLDYPTIVHWHGLRVDSRNDGGGMTLAAPGERYAYDFRVRDRAALYWYHPHPHGRTAEQTYRGLFGLIEVEDDDERRLRAALHLIPGKNEIPLVIQDRRPGSDYAASDADSMHGLLGDAVFINGGACSHLDVASRVYRFRVLNASNARTYRLGLRTAGEAAAFRSDWRRRRPTGRAHATRHSRLGRAIDILVDCPVPLSARR